MIKPLVVTDLRTSEDRGRLQGGKMFNWTVINDMPRGIANSTGAVGTESIAMSPVMTEATLVSKTSGGGVTRSGKVAMGTGIGGAVLSIVAKKMTSKAFG